MPKKIASILIWFRHYEQMCWNEIPAFVANVMDLTPSTLAHPWRSWPPLQGQATSAELREEVYSTGCDWLCAGTGRRVAIEQSW